MSYDCNVNSSIIANRGVFTSHNGSISVQFGRYVVLFTAASPPHQPSTTPLLAKDVLLDEAPADLGLTHQSPSTGPSYADSLIQSDRMQGFAHHFILLQYGQSLMLYLFFFLEIAGK